MDEAYARRYADLYARHWWWRARERLILDRIAGLAGDRGFGGILDVGCGDGLLLPRLAAFGEPEGLEPDPSAVGRESLRRHTIHTVPFDEAFDPGRRFGLISMLDVLEHLDDPAAALRRARDLLVPGGFLLLTVPAFRLLWSQHDVINHHRTRYRAGELEALARAAGLEIDELRYFFHWLFPLKLAVRGWEVVAGASGPPSVPPAPINRTLLALSRAEAVSWGRLRWPFGSSLLLIARNPDRAADVPDAAVGSADGRPAND